MIEGRPFIRSRVSRIARGQRSPANSVRKSAIRTPIGIAIAVAMRDDHGGADERRADPGRVRP